MSNVRVKKRNGSIEPMNLEKMHVMVERACSNLAGVIFPHTIPQKDVNDMVLGGQNIKTILESNTYKNLQAELKFTNWKRNEQRTGQKTKRFY